MKKKLSLVRETLAPLSPSDLEDVNGGTNSAILRSAIKVTAWITRNACPSISIETVTRALGCNGNGGGGNKQ